MNTNSKKRFILANISERRTSTQGMVWLLQGNHTIAMRTYAPWFRAGFQSNSLLASYRAGLAMVPAADMTRAERRQRIEALASVRSLSEVKQRMAKGV